MSILVYAFSNQWGTNIARRTLSELQKLISTPNTSFLPVFFHPQSFFHKYIEFNNYSLIIGLGDGPKYLSKIKIETQAKNSYNDREIYPFSPIFLDLSLPVIENYDSTLVQFGDNMGTYNCNWLAYRTQLHLLQKGLKIHHLFFHLPPSRNATLIARQIENLLKNNNILL